MIGAGSKLLDKDPRERREKGEKEETGYEQMVFVTIWLLHGKTTNTVHDLILKNLY